MAVRSYRLYPHVTTLDLPSIESIRQDVEYALRALRREPAIALIATLILALGID
jgi:hypothetical protein